LEAPFGREIAQLMISALEIVFIRDALTRASDCTQRDQNNYFCVVSMFGVGNRKLLCILLIALFLVSASGCRKKAAVSIPVPVPAAPAVAIAPPPPPPAIIPSEPSPASAESIQAVALPKIVTMPNYFEMAELNFLAGEYKQAAQAFETFLKTAPKSKDHDQALFHLGLSRALATDSSRDLRQAMVAFRRLIAEFPQSPYRSQAEFIVGLQWQIEKLRADVKERDEKIKKLSDELQTLKQIDLQRRPATKAKE
jgi:hypothetical protein